MLAAIFQNRPWLFSWIADCRLESQNTETRLYHLIQKLLESLVNSTRAGTDN